MSRNFGIGDAHQGDDNIWPIGNNENDEGGSESDITFKEKLQILGVIAAFVAFCVVIGFLVYWLDSLFGDWLRARVGDLFKWLIARLQQFLS